jgi:hypothetical protein
MHAGQNAEELWARDPQPPDSPVPAARYFCRLRLKVRSGLPLGEQAIPGGSAYRIRCPSVLLNACSAYGPSFRGATSATSLSGVATISLPTSLRPWSMTRPPNDLLMPSERWLAGPTCCSLQPASFCYLLLSATRPLLSSIARWCLTPMANASPSGLTRFLSSRFAARGLRRLGSWSWRTGRPPGPRRNSPRIRRKAVPILPAAGSSAAPFSSSSRPARSLH